MFIVSDSDIPEELVLVEHRRGRADIDEINRRIDKIWAEKLSTEDGRREIAGALGISETELRPAAKQSSPIAADGSAGIEANALIIVGEWAVTSIVIPVLVGLAKDEVKRRLVSLWKDVILPALKENDEDVVRDEVKR